MNTLLDYPGQAVASLAAAAVAAALLLYASSTNDSKRPSGTLRPPQVRSFLPFLGSAIEMGSGITKVIRKYSHDFNAPVFTATILGDKCVFLADPEIINIVFRSAYQKKLDGLSLQKQFVANVLTCNSTELEENYSDRAMKVGLPQYHHYLFKGEELNTSMGKVQDFFFDFIPELTDQDKGWTQHDLFALVVTAVYKASVGPLLSGSLVSDESVQAFRMFDAGIIPLFNGAPSLYTRTSTKARQWLLQQLQDPSFWQDASPLMKKRREELPVSPAALDKANLGLLFASVGTSAPAVFWTLCRLLQDEEAWNACRAQVEEVVAKRNDQKRTRFSLDDLDQMTFLQSAFWETLRLYSGNFTARRVVEGFEVDTREGKYWIEKGSKLMSFWDVLHSDPDIFDNPDQFQYDRFVNPEQVFTYKSGKKLTHAPVMSFGGGSHLCPGRKFIGYEVPLFLAMLMLNFDMRLAEGESRPGIDLAMQGVGVSHPDRDPKVEIRVIQ
jgi:hypothetical protein